MALINGHESMIGVRINCANTEKYRLSDMMIIIIIMCPEFATTARYGYAYGAYALIKVYKSIDRLNGVRLNYAENCAALNTMNEYTAQWPCDSSFVEQISKDAAISGGERTQNNVVCER